MADATAEFFEQLGERGHEPLLRKITGTLRFDLKQGKKIERWHVAVKKGDVHVSHRNVAADSVVRTEKALFDRAASGELNLMAAVLRGEVALEGHWRLLVLFQRLLPGPHGSSEPRLAAGYARRQQ